MLPEFQVRIERTGKADRVHGRERIPHGHLPETVQVASDEMLIRLVHPVHQHVEHLAGEIREAVRLPPSVDVVEDIRGQEAFRQEQRAFGFADDGDTPPGTAFPVGFYNGESPCGIRGDLPHERNRLPAGSFALPAGENDRRYQEKGKTAASFHGYWYSQVNSTGLWSDRYDSP